MQQNVFDLLCSAPDHKRNQRTIELENTDQVIRATHEKSKSIEIDHLYYEEKLRASLFHVSQGDDWMSLKDTIM
jgi:Zn-dependent oligopeptidase